MQVSPPREPFSATLDRALADENHCLCGTSWLLHEQSRQLDERSGHLDERTRDLDERIQYLDNREQFIGERTLVVDERQQLMIERIRLVQHWETHLGFCNSRVMRIITVAVVGTFDCIIIDWLDGELKRRAYPLHVRYFVLGMLGVLTGIKLVYIWDHWRWVLRKLHIYSD